MMCSAGRQDSVGLMLEEASEAVYEGQRRCVAWGEWSLRQVTELHCAVRESHKESLPNQFHGGNSTFFGNWKSQILAHRLQLTVW